LILIGENLLVSLTRKVYHAVSWASKGKTMPEMGDVAGGTVVSRRKLRRGIRKRISEVVKNARKSGDTKTLKRMARSRKA